MPDALLQEGIGKALKVSTTKKRKSEFTIIEDQIERKIKNLVCHHFINLLIFQDTVFSYSRDKFHD